MLKLERIEIHNFKSFKDCSIDFSDFNVVVGRNASGKTNLVELFKLLKMIYVERQEFPFLDWWGYDNVVWMGEVLEGPITTVKFFFELMGYKFSFESAFTGVGGKFDILKEELNIYGYLKIERKGQWIRCTLDENFLDKNWEMVRNIKGLNSDPINQCIKKGKDFFKAQEVKVSNEDIGKQDLTYLRSGHSGSFSYHGDLVLTRVSYDSKEQQKIFTFEPKITHEVKRVTKEGKDKYDQETEPLSRYLCEEIARFFSQIVILKGINYSFIREPSKPRKEHVILEDGRNVINVLYTLFLKNNNKLPDRLKQILSYIFNDTTLLFDLTQDGRILMRLFEKYASGRQLELAAPGISDGFYKVLTILTAIESEPSLLMIDELENSLHAEALELLVDELESSHFMTIITTHSPVVVDIVGPEDLILVSKGDEGSIFERTKNPEKIREELTKAKITLSERWLYGKL